MSQSFIILIYIILLLMQKKMLIQFFKKLSSDSSAMGSLLKDVAVVVGGYLLGKSKIIIILFVIYYIGFTIGSVPYAFFLSLFAALFSIVPYIGNIIGGGIAVFLSFIHSGTTQALIVLGVITAAQILENYIFTPWIIGDEIDLNPFITSFGVILFSSTWRMFEHTRNMEPYAFLLKNKGRF